MAAQLNHTIVEAADRDGSASWLAGMLGLAEPTEFGPFKVVQTANDVSLDYLQTDGAVSSQHYAFLVSEAEFDEILGRITERGVPHWADPGHGRPNEINTNDGGRGVYFADPEGHNMEILTRPYGSGS